MKIGDTVLFKNDRVGAYSKYIDSKGKVIGNSESGEYISVHFYDRDIVGILADRFTICYNSKSHPLTKIFQNE